RAKLLLPQILNKRVFSWPLFYEGCYLMFWGFFKKLFIADNVASIAKTAFSQYQSMSGADILIGVYAFAIQIYCDFSGYSDIARGLGKTMGFDLIWNFNLPYFSKNPSEFWKRWHISLSTWLRDYLYIPLGGNRFGNIFTYRNLIITMLLGGLWHGAAWTFVLWGMYHGILLAGHRLIQPYLQKLFLNTNQLVKNMFSVLSVVVMFNLVCLGWIFFRAGNLTTAFSMIGKIVTDFGDINISVVNELVVYIWVLIFVEVYQYFSDDLLAIYKTKPVIKWAFYFVCMLLMVVLGSYSGHSFIYFQF
ncbi:MAG: MBOAT family O-acyltransferase, partial [bacterium]